MKPPPHAFWASQITTYGLYPVLCVLAELEDMEEYEICADVMKGIRKLDELLPEQTPRPTREGDAWSEYAKYCNRIGFSPILLAMDMTDYVVREAGNYYEK